MITRIFPPSAIEALTNVSPMKLRDWRRRGLVDDLGVYALPDGGWTKDSKHPDLGERNSWMYREGDVIRLATTVILTRLGIELATALEISRWAVPHVRAWLTDDSPQQRDPRFLIAYPTGMGETVLHPDVSVQVARLTDLNNLSASACPGAIVVDLAQMAASLPASLRQAVSGVA